MKRAELIIANVICGFLVAASLTAVFVSIAPADVLKDWNIKTNKTSYMSGETLSFTSTSTKLRKADGVAYRAIECDRPGDKTVAYSIDSVEIGRSPGYSSKPAEIIVPTRITNRPTTCRLIISVDYRLYFFRHTVEYAASNDFIVQ